MSTSCKKQSKTSVVYEPEPDPFQNYSTIFLLQIDYLKLLKLFKVIKFLIYFLFVVGYF